MNNIKYFTHIRFMRKPLFYQPMKNLDEKETFLREFVKKEDKNEIGK